MNTIAASDVVVGERFRRDPGDLDLLAESIREAGLLQPILVTPDNRLVAGARRLEACRDLLGWEEIPARVVEDCSPELGTLVENEVREDLTDIELSELAEKLRLDALPHGGAQSQFEAKALSGKDLDRQHHGANGKNGQLVAKLMSKRAAAKAVGLSSGKQHRIDLVKSRGIPELVELLESGEITPTAAAVIAAQPEDRQREIVALPARARREEVRKLREERVNVSKRPRQQTSLQRVTHGMARLRADLNAARTDSVANASRADIEKALLEMKRVQEELDAARASCEAALEAAPRRKPRRNKQKEEPRPPERALIVISEADLNERWARLSDAKRKRAALKASLASLAVDARERDGVNLRQACEATAKGTEWAPSTVLDWIYGKGGAAGLVDYPRHLWALVMAPGHVGGSREAECDPAAWEAFKQDYLRPEQPTLEQCYRNIVRLAEQEGWTIPRSAAALKRKLEREVHPDAIVLAREGAEALSKRRPPQIRERPQRAMEAVNGDARKSDVFVKWPDGEIARPWLMGWQDIGFSKVLACRIDKSENSDGYRLAFSDVLRDYGIPTHVYMDNGRAFAAKGLTGGAKTRYRFKAKADDPVGLLTQLVGPEGIHWTQPYHGQSKPIERAFRDIASDIDKDHRLRGAYTGNKPDAKPENYKSKAIPLEKFIQVVADGIARHNARRGRRGLGLDGRSFDEAFQASRELHAADIARPTEAQLTRWLLGAEKIRAHKDSGAVTLFETRYWSERLTEKLAGKSAAERDVVVRFDPDHLDRPVTVETLDGKLIAQAEPQGAVKFRDSQAARETARDQKRLKRHAREQLEIHKGMSDREYERMLDEVDEETRDAKQPPARSKVVAGAFGREPARAKPAPVAATGTDDLLISMVDRAIPSIDDEEDVT